MAKKRARKSSVKKSVSNSSKKEYSSRKIIKSVRNLFVSVVITLIFHLLAKSGYSPFTTIVFQYFTILFLFISIAFLLVLIIYVFLKLLRK